MSNPTCSFHGDLINAVLENRRSQFWEAIPTPRSQRAPYEDAAYIAASLPTNGRPRGSFFFDEVAVAISNDLSRSKQLVCALKLVMHLPDFPTDRRTYSFGWEGGWVLFPGQVPHHPGRHFVNSNDFGRQFMFSDLAPYALREVLLDMACGRRRSEVVNSAAYHACLKSLLSNRHYPSHTHDVRRKE